MKSILVFTVAGLCLLGEVSFSQNIAVNTTGTAAAAANLFEVTQPAGAANNSVSIFAKHLGTGTNAYAIWAEATGATNKYALVVPASGGNVGIGTTTPSAPLDVRSVLAPTAASYNLPGVNIQNTVTPAAGATSGWQYGIFNEATKAGAVNTTGIFGAEMQATQNGSGTIQYVTALDVTTRKFASGSGLVTNNRGVSIGMGIDATFGINATNTVGLYINDMNNVNSTTNYAIHYDYTTAPFVVAANGRVGVGIAPPSWDVDVTKSSATGGVIVNAQNTSAGANASAGFLTQNDAFKWAELTIGSSTATTTTFGMANANMANFLSNVTVALGNSTNAPIIFGTNNVERMRLLNSGTLKMTGTSITSPGIWMDGTVTGAAGTAYGILSRGTLTAAANNDIFIPFSNYLGSVNTGTFTGLTFYGAHLDGNSWTKSGTGTIDNGYGLYVTAPTIATANYAAVFTGGNVGIGTTSPKNTQHIYSASNSDVTTTYGPDVATNTDGINVGYGGSTFGVGQSFLNAHSATAGNGKLNFQVNFSTKMTILNNGNVGIGTTTADTKLHVSGGNGTTLKIVDGNQANGKVLTSDANGVASWATGAGTSGSGFVRLLYNDETDNTYASTTTGARTYALPANSYSQVMVEAEVFVTGGNWTFTINYNGAAVQTLTLTPASIAGGVVKYAAVATGAQNLTLDVTRTSGTSGSVTGFRVYAIY